MVTLSNGELKAPEKKEKPAKAAPKKAKKNG